MSAAGQTPDPPFLRLPKHLRLEIYYLSTDYCSNLLLETVNLNNTGKPQERCYGKQIRPKCVDVSAHTYSLMLTCRTIYTEVAASFFSTYNIYVRYRDCGNLEALRRLSVGSLRALRSLTIHLNVASCGLGRPSDYSYPIDDPHSHDRDHPLCTNEDRTAKVIVEWQDVWVNFLKPNIVEPADFRLSLTCDVEDFEIAQKVVQPLLEEPRLSFAGCSVRLSYRRNASLQRLAEKVVAYTTGNAEAYEQDATEKAGSPPFRFMDLPTEIRHQILECTNLVPPSGEIEWNPSHGFYYRRKMKGQHVRFESGRWEDRDKSKNLYCWDVDSEGGGGCYCKVFHGASSSMYPCDCLAPPTPLFLVSHAMRHESLRVFFGKNRFVIAPLEGITWKEIENARSVGEAQGEMIQKLELDIKYRLHTSIFLKDVVPEIALQHLRYLELVFAPSRFMFNEPGIYCPDGSPELLDWIQTLDYVKERLNLKRIVIRAYFAGWCPDSILDLIADESSEAHWRVGMTLQKSLDLFHSYNRTLAPIVRLKGLRHFFVHLPNVWLRSRVWIYSRVYNETLAKKLRCQSYGFERRIEEAVMGRDYKARKVGKWHCPRSEWLEDHEFIQCRSI